MLSFERWQDSWVSLFGSLAPGISLRTGQTCPVLAGSPGLILGLHFCLTERGGVNFGTVTPVKSWLKYNGLYLFKIDVLDAIFNHI